MPSKTLPPSHFAFRRTPLLPALVAIAIGSYIGSSSIIGVSIQYINLPSSIEIDGRKLVHQIHLTLWILSIQTFLFIGVGTLFFLGYYRFETPARSEPDVAAGDTTKSASDTTLNTLWLYECQHNQENYLCFPPYCAPGGLRSRLFPSVTESAHSEHKIEITASSTAETNKSESTSEETSSEDDLFTLHDPFNIPFPKSQTSPSRKRRPSKEDLDDSSSSRLSYSTTTSTNPLDLILQNPYLPLPYFVRQALEGRKYDWDTLGGSQCSCRRYQLAVQKELELAGLETTSNKAEINFLPQAKENCENHSSARPLGNQNSQEQSLWGLRTTAKKLVSQALSSYYSLASELEPRPQDPNHKAEHHQQDIHRKPKLQQVPYIQPTMTAQENTEPPLPASAPVYSDSDNPAGKPIPQAVLVYHESAHSIVFRDHLRRQQGAIRRASSQMENSSHHGRGASPSPSPDNRRAGVAKQKHYMQPVTEESTPRSTPAPSREASSVLEVSESDIGYESGGSRGSSHSARSGGDSSSITSGGSRSYRKVKSGLSKTTKQKKAAPPAPAMQAVVIANFQPVVEPLEALDLNSSNVFEPLMEADPLKKEFPLEMTEAEKEVVELLKNEQAVVKTIRNADWTAFLQKFKPSEEGGRGTHEHHPAQQRRKQQSQAVTKTSEIEYPFNSFVTSTSLLPSCAKKMRCFGSTNEYAVGVVFGMPTCFPNDESEDAAAKRTKTWSWPSGYSAKTEFNIDHHGNLINGREEALVPLSGMRSMNHAYLHDTDYIVGGRMVKGGLTTIPYNEVYIRVGGLGRVANGIDLTTGKKSNDADSSGRSFDHGMGLPIALFVREADYGHLVRLLRTRARYSALFGADSARGIPLLYITPESGVRVFTEKLQQQVLKTMAWDLNPFQNPSLAHRTGIDNTSETHLQQKLEELLDLDDDNMKQVLTPEEMARIAGGFGATDESVANMLNQAMQRDISEGKGKSAESGHNLQDLVNEGLSFALRANDYHTSRQLLILYTLVAARGRSNSENTALLESKSDEGYQSDTSKASSSSKKWREAEKNMEGEKERHLFRDERALGKDYIPAPPPPPPLDTDRLRSATNSDGLLAVLGAAQVLRAMQDGSAKRRVKESIDSIEEWIQNGEQSVAFRVASWRDQRAAQGDLKIAMENDSNFMAFISNKAISNRKKFAKQLRDAAAVTDFDSLQFLKAIHSVCLALHSPCLRLELLQYILGLDNRYSVAHVTRSVELAATCLNLSENDVFSEDTEKKMDMLK